MVDLDDLLKVPAKWKFFMVLFQAIGARWRAGMEAYNWGRKLQRLPELNKNVLTNYPEIEVVCLIQIWCTDLISLSITISNYKLHIHYNSKKH